jgi:PAS domain S-box-containing protein
VLFRSLTLFGFTSQDLENGINALSFIEPTQRERVKENTGKDVNGKSFEPQEYTAIRKDGSRFPVMVYSAPVYRNRKLTGFRGVIVDISARQK